ncbi:unnamed protein product [Paramecium sonneborni]|uniref:Uncharacterized protein n=1 Tax=Paramecium sonneborni TaxID=65129 RepID=A0A8S1RNL9_9CILI|nr:unnamed protein product [Paramecium sonneborni]
MGNLSKKSEFEQVILYEQCLFFDIQLNRWLDKIYQPQLYQEKEIEYIYDRNIIRQLQNYSTSEHEIFNNKEQVKQLKWDGKYRNNFQKVAKWSIYWNEQILQKAGGYYSEDGQKIGLWKELVKNYCSWIPVFEEGEYFEGKKIGSWKYNYEQKKLDNFGGQYNEQGQKIGKWAELDESFWLGNQVIHIGEYKSKGIKIGRWDISYCHGQKDVFIQIGGGSYKDGEDFIKIGRWVELDERFWYQKQVIYNGEYNIKGKKVGRWDSMYQSFNQNEYKQMQILYNLSGGGSYGDGEGLIKIGRWVELDKRFWYEKQVIYNGEYNIKGMKVGRWDIGYCEKGKQEYKQIGGGSYDEEQGQIQIGRWIELDQGFAHLKQVTYNGEYNVKGIKIGRWDINYCDPYGDKKYRQIGGGTYEEGESQIKIGKWVELLDGFYYYAQLIYKGEYNMKGMKIGRWDINYRVQEKYEYKQIGGGSYVEGEGQFKIGRWVELDEGFTNWKQVTYNGQYKIQGKVGRWNTAYKGQKIGGGQYGESDGQIKIGRWVELDEGFASFKQVTYNGEYNMKGMKKGRWDIWFNWDGKNEQMVEQQYFSGGGSYCEKEGSIKIGRWVELDQLFSVNKQVTYEGEYNMKGIKIGIWAEKNIYTNQKLGEKKYDI